MPRSLYPCLWFKQNAAEAVAFYCSLFPDSRILNQSPVVINWEMNGSHFMAINDPRSPGDFNDSFSFVIPCEDQAEIDYYWEKLTSDGGKEGRCGWCKDKYGLSWQVVPVILGQLMSDPARGQRVVQAFLQMNKFDIDTLLKA